MDWKNINIEVQKYLEWYILPNLISFIIYRLYINNTLITDSYISIQNTLKTYINIVDENDYLIYKMVIDILDNKYKLKIVNLNPLIVKKS